MERSVTLLFIEEDRHATVCNKHLTLEVFHQTRLKREKVMFSHPFSCIIPTIDEQPEKLTR
jgi:hypothetical protein